MSIKKAIKVGAIILATILVLAVALSLVQVYRNIVRANIQDLMQVVMHENRDITHGIFMFDNEAEVEEFLWDKLLNHLDMRVRSIRACFETDYSLPRYFSKETKLHTRRIYINGIRAFTMTMDEEFKNFISQFYN